MELQAWETEWASRVVWGTHDAEQAHATFSAYYEKEFGVTDPEVVGSEKDWVNADRFWVDPKMLEEEVWSEANIAHSDPPEGWVPVIVWTP